jgi:hypothetical protein
LVKKALMTAMGITALAAGPVLAHHSFAMFDLDKEVTVSGTVKEFQWTNPHVWIQVYLPDEKGVLKEWSIEGASIGLMARNGWNGQMIKPGDKITMVIHPARSDRPSGSLVRATLADGRVLGPGGHTAPLPLR